MVKDEILLTQEGYDKIVEEHDELVSVRRAEVAERIKEAISYGDLSENAEFDAAKNEQAELEERIQKLENFIRRGKVISESEISSGKVNLGHTVRVKYLNNDEEAEYTIVGSTESDPFSGKISNESAIGGALLGTEVGQKIDVETQEGLLKLEIMDFSR